MTIRSCLLTLAPVLVIGAMPSPCESNRPEVDGRQIPTFTCRFDVAGRPDERECSQFAVRWIRGVPQYTVAFNHYQGSACLERHEQPWPETFVLKITGWRDTILFVSLTPDGFGAMDVHSIPGQNWVTYFDNRGQWLDGPADNAFRIETDETADGEELTVKVTLPRQARTMRKLDIKYYSTAW